MVSPLFFSQLVLLALVWLCVMLQWAWPSDPAAACPPLELPPLLPKRSREPTPFAGLTTKPPCDACEHTTDSRPQAPSVPPPRLVPTRGRRRQVDTLTHFCPNPDQTVPSPSLLWWGVRVTLPCKPPARRVTTPRK